MKTQKQYLIFFILSSYSLLISVTQASTSQQITSKKKSTELNITTPIIDNINSFNTSSRSTYNNKKIITRLESLNNSSTVSLLILAQAYEDSKDYKNQIRILKQIVKKNKKNGDYLLKLVTGFRNLYFKTGLFTDRAKAMNTLKQVYSRFKKHREKAHLEMITLLKYKEDSKETNYEILKLIQTVIKDFGAKKIYVNDLCRYLYINNFYKQSRSFCKTLIKKYPKEAPNYIYYALSMNKQNNIEKYLKKAGEKFPKNDFVQIHTGQFYLNKEEYTTALPYYKNVLIVNPLSSKGQIGMAKILFNTKKQKQSYKHFLKSCLLNKPLMLWEFQKAKAILNQKNKSALANMFSRGITQCMFYSKKAH